MEDKEKREVNAKVFDEEIEGYAKCGSTTTIFNCKKDCIIVYTPLLSYLN